VILKALKKIKFILKSMKIAWIQSSILSNSAFILNRLRGEIIRNTHSIEKGLSLEHVKLGFGFIKIKDTTNYISKFLDNGGSWDDISIKMFFSALKEYLAFHKKNGFSNKDIKWINQYYETNYHKVLYFDNYGGIQVVKKLSFSDEERHLVKRIFYTRHSAREFTKEPINEEHLKQAIEMAMHCPSACNRQCYRCYIVDKNNFTKLGDWLSGSGGFASELDKVLVVTGNISVYRPEEMQQWLITGSIFASYLSLSLHVFDIGCCFMQRYVIPQKGNSSIMNRLGIPLDEQIICCLGIGNLKDEYKAPISHRFDYTDIVKKI
jgi:nitroreductase